MNTNIRSISSEAPASHLSWSIDTLEQIMIESEREIARHRSTQLAALQLLDQAQAATADGARTLSEWVARRLDVSIHTARSLVRTMRRTEDHPELRESLADGDATFDRIEAVSKVEKPGSDRLLSHLDVSGVYREAARQARLTSSQEERTFLDQHLILQPTLDQSWFRIFGGVEGTAGAVIDKALNEMADKIAEQEGIPSDSAWRKAVALAHICAGEEPPPAQVTVFVDADVATATNGEAGVYLQAGPRVGLEALKAILCDSVTELTVNTKDGQPMRYGRRSRSIPPHLRRAIIHRDGNRCAIDGCDSRNRLQVHHINPWYPNGRTDPENLITACWWHHQVAIHRLGLTPYRHPEHGRWWLRPATRPPPDWLNP